MKTALVTGANTGIGEVTARELARQGYRVFLACRSEAKAREAMARIVALVPSAELEFHELDLNSLKRTRESAERFLARNVPLHLLVNNAGLAGKRGTTEDGFEVHFGVNHLGPYLFTRLLEKKLRETAQASGPVRIVNVASMAHYDPKGIDWSTLQRPVRTLTGYREYGVSKLCNVLFTREHARRLQGSGVHTYALHPGVVASDVWRHVPWPVRSIIKLWMISNEEGARTPVYCATEPSLSAESGLYYDECRTKEPSSVAQDEALAAQLWAQSAEWCGLPVDG